jgi:uncharacterized Tic20 family protein
MAYTELFQFIGAFVRWSLSGFKRPYIEFHDEKFEKQNFAASVVFLIVIFLMILPAIGFLLRD